MSNKVGYMLQKDHLFDWRTIFQNVILGLEIQGTLTTQTRQYVIDLLDTYGLSEFKDKYPNQLSGGMRQRAALIRTLAINRKFFCLMRRFQRWIIRPDLQ